ncbi:MAG: DUF2232 domain-containing protein [Bacillota bacterium]|nr:DUF2232 domain-containing protein [Bacillota bacterium]
MHLLFIFFLVIVMPFLVMPRDITAAKKEPYEIVVQGIVGACAGAVIVLLAASLTGQGVFHQIQAAVEDMSGTIAGDDSIISLFNMTDMDEADRIEFFNTLYGSMVKQIPAYIMLLSAISSYISYIILSRSLGKRSPVKMMPKFREFSFPRGTVFGLVAMYMGSWIMTTTEMLASDALYVNMNLIFDFAFSLQGISVILMFFYVKRFPKTLAVICAVIFWVTVIGRMMLVLLGMMDLIMGLKSRMATQDRKPR